MDASDFSVIFSAINFALYTNPRRIYLVGCDCSNNGYFDGKKQTALFFVENVKKGYEKLKEFTKIYYPDTKIISINPVGLQGLFEDLKQ